ncbi:uncharacterized protein VTP21DRAFT_1107 [Calcarisporiella thermophila]|uniref:uncharacterized protein n=1 Tax=Calcarisporiella thermophila TaxID=911321 RepID=UPI003744547E
MVLVEAQQIGVKRKGADILDRSEQKRLNCSTKSMQEPPYTFGSMAGIEVMEGIEPEEVKQQTSLNRVQRAMVLKPVTYFDYSDQGGLRWSGGCIL